MDRSYKDDEGNKYNPSMLRIPYEPYTDAVTRRDEMAARARESRLDALTKTDLGVYEGYSREGVPVNNPIRKKRKPDQPIGLLGNLIIFAMIGFGLYLIFFLS